MMMFHAAAAVGSTIAQRVAYSPRLRTMMNVGMMPPLNHMVKAM